MAGSSKRRRGFGFGAGLLAGLVFSGAVLAGLSLSVPVENPQASATPAAGQAETAPPPRTAPQTATPTSTPDNTPSADASAEAAAREASAAPPSQADPAPQAAMQPAPSSSATAPAVPAPAETPAPASAPDIAGSQAADDGTPAATRAVPDQPTATAPPPQEDATAPIAAASPPAAAPEPSARSGTAGNAETTAQVASEAVPQARPEPEPASDVTPPAATAPDTSGAQNTAPTPEPLEAEAIAPTDRPMEVAAAPSAVTPAPVATPSAPPPARPLPPAWRRNAAIATLDPERAVMSVIVTNARPTSLPALTTLAPLGAITVAIHPDVSDPVALAEALRNLGHEVLETVTAGSAPTLDTAAGIALASVADTQGAEAALAAIAPFGGLAVDLDRGETSPLVQAGREAEQPVAGAALRIVPGDSASNAFQTLRDAGGLAAREGELVVALDAGPVTLTALGRWLALPGDVQPAPLSALIERLGPTRY